MKITVFIGLFLCIQHLGSSCTIIPNAFCTTLDLFPDNLVISGIIVSIDSTGIDIEILEILRGEESRETIRVWDGTDFDCNGIWSMAASDIGELYDTIIIILPKITEAENEWDVPGDYKRPDPYWQTSELIVEGGNAEGFISGDAIAPSEYNIWMLEYNELKNAILSEGDCSSLILAAGEAKAASSITVNNPFHSVILVQLDHPIQKGYMTLYSMDGYPILKKEINSERQIELECVGLPAGMYLLEVKTNDRHEIVKLLKPEKR